MSITDNIHKTHREYTEDKKNIEVTGETIGDCIKNLIERYPGMQSALFDAKGKLLNQIEIYFSILQRKALTPNDFPSLEALQERILGFQQHYESIAAPFQWKFTKDDLHELLAKLHRPCSNALKLAA